MICLLCGKRIELWENYHVIGDDWPGNEYRAHDRCITEQINRWTEIKRDAKPTPAPPPEAT